MYSTIEEDVTDKKVKPPVNLLLSEANKYSRLLRYGEAVASYERILDYYPSNFRAILARAKCYLKLGKYQEAEENFRRAIEVNPKSTEAIYLKGVAEYYRGDFERGFLTHWGESTKKPSQDKLRHGYQLCKYVIKDSLATDELTRLQETDIRKINASEFSEKLQSEYNPKGLYSKDLIVLDNMLKDENLSTIHAHAKDAFQYLKSRQRFAKMLKPGIGRKRKTQPVRNRTHLSATMNQLRHKLNKMKSFLKEGDIDSSVKIGNEISQNLKKLSNEKLPEKAETEALTLHYLGLAFMVDEQTASATECFEKQLSICRKNRLSRTESRALRDLGDLYMKKHLYNKAFGCFQESSTRARSDEQAVLLYKLSDCATHLNNFEYAQTTAEELLKCAVDANDSRFQLDIILLLAEIAVKSKKMKVAQNCYEKAVRAATESHDSRQKDIENLFDMFQTTFNKNSNSDERFQVVKSTQELMHMIQQNLNT